MTTWQVVVYFLSSILIWSGIIGAIANTGEFGVNIATYFILLGSLGWVVLTLGFLYMYRYRNLKLFETSKGSR